MNANQIASATAAQLVSFYNAHAAAPVKRFADRKTAERRVAALVAEIAPTVKAVKPATKVHHADRSAAMALSWTDPDVAAKRSERTSVTVTVKGSSAQEFKSTAAAFRALGLSLAGVIKFRMALKEKGALAYDETYKFKVAK